MTTHSEISSIVEKCIFLISQIADLEENSIFNKME